MLLSPSSLGLLLSVVSFGLAVGIPQDVPATPKFAPQDISYTAENGSEANKTGQDGEELFTKFWWLQKTDYPVVKNRPTYHNNINATEVAWVMQCLAQWCEKDHFLDKKHGRAMCFTSSEHRPQGGTIGFICNQEDKARCSRITLAKAMYTLNTDTGSPSGWVDLQTGSKNRMSIGFDTYCLGGTDCGVARNPIEAACPGGRRNNGKKAQFQYEITDHEMAEAMNSKKEEDTYLGAKIVNKPQFVKSVKST